MHVGCRWLCAATEPSDFFFGLWYPTVSGGKNKEVKKRPERGPWTLTYTCQLKCARRVQARTFFCLDNWKENVADDLNSTTKLKILLRYLDGEDFFLKVAVLDWTDPHQINGQDLQNMVLHFPNHESLSPRKITELIRWVSVGKEIKTKNGKKKEPSNWVHWNKESDNEE